MTRDYLVARGPRTVRKEAGVVLTEGLRVVPAMTPATRAEDLLLGSLLVPAVGPVWRPGVRAGSVVALFLAF